MKTDIEAAHQAPQVDEVPRRVTAEQVDEARIYTLSGLDPEGSLTECPQPKSLAQFGRLLASLTTYKKRLEARTKEVNGRLGELLPKYIDAILEEGVSRQVVTIDGVDYRVGTKEVRTVKVRDGVEQKALMEALRGAELGALIQTVVLTDDVEALKAQLGTDSEFVGESVNAQSLRKAVNELRDGDEGLPDGLEALLDFDSIPQLSITKD